MTGLGPEAFGLPPGIVPRPIGKKADSSAALRNDKREKIYGMTNPREELRKTNERRAAE
jgi:hypothetical protein